jgi:succinate dehydrogenase/fumarate reductase flavoprotein subunit
MVNEYSPGFSPNKDEVVVNLFDEDNEYYFTELDNKMLTNFEIFKQIDNKGKTLKEVKDIKNNLHTIKLDNE